MYRQPAFYTMPTTSGQTLLGPAPRPVALHKLRSSFLNEKADPNCETGRTTVTFGQKLEPKSNQIRFNLEF